MDPQSDAVTERLHEIEALWNPQAAAESESAYRAILPEAHQSKIESRRFESIVILAWLARAQSAQGKFSEAELTLAGASKLIEEEQANSPVSVRIRWLIERGRLWILQKTPSQARPVFSEAWTLASNSGEDHFAVEIALLMSEIESPKAQLEWTERAIRIAEASTSERARKWLGTLYLAWGWKQYALRQPEKALESFRKAQTHSATPTSPNGSFASRWSQGRTLRFLGRTEEALAINQALVSELGIGGRRDGRLYEELAECLHKLNRPEEAQLYFELAYREFSQESWASDTHPLDLKRLKDLGRVRGGG